MKPLLTKEFIEAWRKWLNEGPNELERPGAMDYNALCDLAIAGLEAKAKPENKVIKALEDAWTELDWLLFRFGDHDEHCSAHRKNSGKQNECTCRYTERVLNRKRQLPSAPVKERVCGECGGKVLENGKWLTCENNHHNGANLAFSESAKVN